MISKYNKEKKPLKILRHIYFEVESVESVSSIHNNFSEFVRDAVDAYIIEQKKLIKLNGE